MVRKSSNCCQAIFTVNDPLARCSPSGAHAKVIDVKWLWNAPRQKGRGLALIAHRDHVVGDAHPKGTELVGIQNVRRLAFVHIGLLLIVSDDRLGVSPAAEKHFDHGVRFVALATQNQVGIVRGANFEVHNAIGECEVLVPEVIAGRNL